MLIKSLPLLISLTVLHAQHYFDLLIRGILADKVRQDFSFTSSELQDVSTTRTQGLSEHLCSHRATENLHRKISPFLMNNQDLLPYLSFICLVEGLDFPLEMT